MSSSDLRPLIARFEAELRRLPQPPTDLMHSWTRLVNALALGVTPALQVCPRCGTGARSEARSCGRCSSTLRAVAP